MGEPRDVAMHHVGGSPMEQEGEISDGWRIRVSLEDTPSGPVVKDMHLLSPEGHPQQVTAAAWRSVPVGKVIDGAMANYREAHKWVQAVEDQMWEGWLAEWETLHGPKGHADLLYAQLAQMYCIKVAAGLRNPVDAITADTGWARAATSQRLATARKRGLLKGSELTPEAKKLLGIQQGGRGF